MLDLNHGSQAVYGRPSAPPVADRVNALIDAALIDRNRRQAPRDYLGGSRIGEPCARKLAYEYAHAAVDVGKGFDGRTLRIFDAGHHFEALSIRWMRAAGFDLRTHRSDGEQFGFVTANGRIRGHIDGVIVGGPDVGVSWPALWEHTLQMLLRDAAYRANLATGVFIAPGNVLSSWLAGVLQATGGPPWKPFGAAVLHYPGLIHAPVIQTIRPAACEEIRV